MLGIVSFTHKETWSCLCTTVNRKTGMRHKVQKSFWKDIWRKKNFVKLSGENRKAIRTKVREEREKDYRAWIWMGRMAGLSISTSFLSNKTAHCIWSCLFLPALHFHQRGWRLVHGVVTCSISCCLYHHSKKRIIKRDLRTNGNVWPCDHGSSAPIFSHPIPACLLLVRQTIILCMYSMNSATVENTLIIIIIMVMMLPFSHI